MASRVVDEMHGVPPELDAGPEDPGAGPRRHRLRNVVLAVGALVALVVVAGVLWFVFGRESAEPLSDDQALADFRANSDASTEAAGRPAAGVYAASATGVESIGLPGFDEDLGPNAPLTITYGDEGCFTARMDLNSHHWRSWTYCPDAAGTVALVSLDSWTQRKAPGLDLTTLSTYTCDRPLDLLWSGQGAGETRTGTCRGVSDLDGAVTDDAASVEVLGSESLDVDGEQVEVVHVRTTDEFSNAQTGTEVGEWWMDAATGLPVKVSIVASLSGGSGDYSETIEFRIDSLRPAT